MLKDYIDCKNDATSKFLTDAIESNIMSDEVPAEPPVEHVTTINVDDIYEIECTSVAEEIIIEDVKCFDSSSPDSEIIEIIDNDGVEELQSPIADEVDQLINNEHINSKHALANNEYDKFFDKDLPNNEPISKNDLMEIDTPFLNGNSSQNVEDVKIIAENPVEKILNGDASPNTNDVEIVSKDPVDNFATPANPTESSTEPCASESRPITTEVTDKPYKCYICGKLFSRNSSLKCHIRLHVEGPDSLLRGSSEPTNFKFNFTDLNTKKEDPKKEEVEPAADANNSEIVPFDEPSTVVLNSIQESSELADDDDKREYKCIVCEKTFSRKSSLAFHYKFHPKSPTSKSQEDITVFASETVNDETPMELDPLAVADQFKCDKCDRSFPQKNTYLWHLKMHETNVRRKSSDNSLTANQTNGIKDPDGLMTNHTDDEMNNTDVADESDANLYQCPHCPRSFPRLRGLITHSNVHKRKSVDEQGSESLNQIVYEEVSSRKYSCCKKLHIHNDVTKLYKCNVCCKCFCDIANLKRHLARNHQQEDTSEASASDNDAIVASRKKSISMVNDPRTTRKSSSTRVVEDSAEQKTDNNLRGLYKCGFCNEAFDDVQLLVGHVTVHIQSNNDSVLSTTTDDSGAEELCCVVCEKTFRNQNSLSRHMNEHRRREEEILVRVTSSGRKIRERRPSEDISTTSPIKCIPCNRYFESMRAKRIHEASKHPAEHVEPEQQESEDVDDEEEVVEDNNEEFICECCNKPWASIRSLSIHKSWHRHKQSLAAAEKTPAESLSIDGDQEDEVEEGEKMDSYEPDDSTLPEENKTENDVTSSVKCGCCNILFPNIPALNAHLSGQTNNTVVEATSSMQESESDQTNFGSLRDLVKCDRCDKFCPGIPALKLHIMSDHAKKPVPQNSTESSSIPKPVIASDETKKNSTEISSGSASKPVVASDRTKKNSTEISSGPAPKSVVASDRTKKNYTESSSVPATKSNNVERTKKLDGSSVPVSKPQIISDRAKRSLSRNSGEYWFSPAKKSHFMPDRTKKHVAPSSVESSTIAPKLNIGSSRRKKSISQSSTDFFTATLKANISDQPKNSEVQDSAENCSVALKSNVVDEPEKSIAQSSIEDSKKSNIPDQSKETISLSSAEDSNISAPKSIPENPIVAAEGSSDISNHVEKFTHQNSAENASGLASKSRDISDQPEKSVAQDLIESSCVPAPTSDIISDAEKSTAQSTESLSTSALELKSGLQTVTDSSIVVCAESRDISDDSEKSVPLDSTKDSIIPVVASDDISDPIEQSEPQDPIEELPQSIEISTVPASKSDVTDPSIEPISEISTEKSTLSSEPEVTINDTVPSGSTEKQITTPATTADDVIPAKSQTAPSVEADQPIKTPVVEAANIIPVQEKSIIAEKPVVIISKSVLRRRSIGDRKLEKKNSRESSDDSNLASTSLKSTPVVEPTNDSNEASTSLKSTPAVESANDSKETSTSLKSAPIVQPTNESNRVLTRRKSALVELANDSNVTSASVKSSLAVESANNSVVVADNSKETTFACCDRIFGSSRALKVHQRSHPPVTEVSSALTSTPANEPEKSNDEIDEAADLNDSYVSTNYESDDGIFREFQCSICKKCFNQKKYLRYHRSKHFEPGEIDPEEEKMRFHCTKCNRRFDKESSLRVHKGHHTTVEKSQPIDHGTYTDMRNDIYKCNACEREFENVRGVIKHYSVKHKIKYPCTKCDQSFYSEEDLADHISTAHRKRVSLGEYYTKKLKDGTYKCIDCDRKFEGLRGASKHYLFAHTEQDDDKYQCSQCDRTFNCSQGLAGHSLAHKRVGAKTTDDEEIEEHFSCSDCDKSYSNAKNLNRHRNNVHSQESTDDEEQVEDFSCDRCSKSYSNANSLKKHYNSVHGKTPSGVETEFENDCYCVVCEKEFVSKSNLKRHRRNVHGVNVDDDETEDEQLTEDEAEEQPQDDESYPCTECDRVFNSYRGLNGHMNQHQQYVCPHCNETLPNIRSFNAHIETCVPAESEEDIDLKSQYQCEYCNRLFTSARSLGGHKRVHYGESETEDVEDESERSETESDIDADNESADQPSEFNCTKCDRSFTNARSLSVHVNCHFMQDNPMKLSCPQCDRIFTNYRSLSLHYTSHRVDDTRNVFNCPNCKEIFDSIRGLYEHFGDVHKKTRRSYRLDSRSNSKDTETRSRSKARPEETVVEPTKPQNHLCAKCGQDFTSERSLSSHRRKCISRSKSVEDPTSPRNFKTRSKSVGDRTSSRADSSNVKSVSTDNVVEATSSGIRKSRRLQSFAETASSSKEGKIDVDEQVNVEDETDEPDNNEPKPNCDICSITFEDLKTLAKHLADSHETTTPNDKRHEFTDLQVRLHHCAQCDQIFPDRVGLRRHSLTHSEPIRIPWETPPLNLKCPLCPKIFPTALGFKRHMHSHKNTPVLNTDADQPSVVEPETSQIAPEESLVEIPTEHQSEVEEPKSLTNGVDESIEKSINDTDSTINESIKNTPTPHHQTPNQNDSINQLGESLKDSTASSYDSQSDQSICDDEPNSSRSSLPIVSDEPIACLSCKICARQFNHVKAFNKHVQWHKFNDDAVDGEETNINDDPKQHRATNGTITNGNASTVDLLTFVKCDTCAETFKKADTLRKHAFDVHNITMTSPILYHCGSCEKAFLLGKSLFEHLQSHINKVPSKEEMPYECASCEKCFKIKDDLLEHVKTHLNGIETEPQPHLNGSIDQANMNGTSTSYSDDINLAIPSDHSDDDQNNAELDPDENIHQSKRPKLSFECSECDKTFHRKCHLVTHFRIHKNKLPKDSTILSAKIVSPPKQHQCSLCDKSFRLKTTLAVHVQKHSGDKSLRKALKRSNDDNTYTAEDGVRSSKRICKNIS